MWNFDWSFVHLAGFAFDFAVFGHDSGSNVRGLRGWHWDLLSAIHWFMDNQYNSEVGSVRKGEKLYQKSLYIRPFGDGLPDKYSSPASWALVKYVKLLNTQITHREGLTRLGFETRPRGLACHHPWTHNRHNGEKRRNAVQSRENGEKDQMSAGIKSQRASRPSRKRWD